MTIPAALQAHYDTGSTSMAYATLIQRADGELFGFTSNDVPLVMDVTPWESDVWHFGTSDVAFEFSAEQGMDLSTIVTTSGFNVDNMEITTLDDGTLFERDDIQAGRWRNARWIIFRYRWDVAVPTIADDVEPLLAGTFGDITIGQTTIKIELRGIAQGLQQSIGIASQKTCRVRLGSVGVGMCNVDLAPFTHALTVTGVTDKGTFTASGAIQGADYFGEGIVSWSTGNNAGVEQKVRTFSSGVFTLVLPMVLDIQIGDTFTAVAGCRKRHERSLANPSGVSDCIDKFDNILNFQGEPHRPTQDELLRPV